MSVKRQRPPGSYARPQSRSNKRPKINLDLAQIWENLVDESEDIRLNAVYELLTVHCEGDDPENAKTIAKRLFRGLCSSRKNARQGFYVALVGALSLEDRPFGTTEISLADIIRILDTQTTAEAGTSGQDERDHHFGRLLGCKALLESKALWGSGAQFARGWDQILDILCRLMAQKPWLRAESSVVICSTIPELLKLRLASTDDLNTITSHIFEKLVEHKLIRTIDGIGIWLAFRQSALTVKLPEKVWTSSSPLHKNELQTLKKSLLGKRQSNEDEDLSGMSVWSPRLHPAWRSILRQFSYKENNQVPLADFWREVVDNGLFDASSTPERKHTGFLVLECALREVDASLIPTCLSKNVMACLIQSLQNSSEGYLTKVILKVFDDYESHAKATGAIGVHNLILGLLQGCDYSDFDSRTKSKIISSLFEVKPIYEDDLSDLLLQGLKEDSATETPIIKVAEKRKNILNVFSRATCQAIRELTSKGPDSAQSDNQQWNKIGKILISLLDLREAAFKKTGGMVEWDEGSYATLQEKISLMLEACLAAGSEGQQCFLQVIAALQKNIKLEAEDAIQESFDASWKLFKRLSADNAASTTKGSDENTAQACQGLKLLQALLLYEVYDGDEEAIEMLEDVTSMGEDFLAGNEKAKVADQILEIIISFVSKPSRFRRRACSLIFEAFTPFISSEGIESICRILTTKESRVGQQELFENRDEDLADDSGDDGDSAESGSIGSDVEIVSEDEDANSDSGSDASSSDEDADSNTDAEEGSSDESAASDDQEDEIAKFEGALAAALGTRKFTEDDMADLGSDENADAASDSDMTDSEMMELDDKLAEVFRNQQNQTSAQKMRKEEMKSAKETVINLKNRAIDLVELFFRTQHGRGTECVKLLTSVLQLAESTMTSQLANRGIKLVKAYVAKNKGMRLPKVESSKPVREELQQSLQLLHETIGQKDASNSLIEAASQVNILTCKLLLEAGEDGTRLQGVMGKFSDGHKSEQGSKRKAHDDFWARYDDWNASVQGQKSDKREQAGKESKVGGSKQGTLVVHGHRKASRKD